MLQKAKVKVINLNSQMRAHSQCALLKNEYISAKKDFQKLCRKYKRESWHTYHRHTYHKCIHTIGIHTIGTLSQKIHLVRES